MHSLIKSVVEEFYSKATTDIIIGFHFRHIKDFQEHIPRIIAFWEIQLTGSTQAPIPSFELIQTHVPLKATPGQVRRWARIFEETLEQFSLRFPKEKNFWEKWKDKILRFEKQFVSSPLLFP